MTEVLGPADVERVLALAGAAEAADGVAPLNEQTLIRLRRGEPGGTHLLVAGGAGYAYVDREEGVAELVVHPEQRRRGHGRELLRRAGRPLRVWAHGDLPAARALATGEGLEPVRTLLLMERPLGDEPDEPVLAAGTTLRSFRPGADDAEWLRVNAAAFAHHPEQGRWTQADLDDRKAEPWFDPAGFLIAERDGRAAGFHWTKVHPDGTGEVYVLGVDPGAQGGGLGRALTLAGLRHLRGRGVTRVVLYTDGDNTRALAVYEGLGFTVAARDVMYARGE